MPVTRTRRRQESTEVPKTQDSVKPVRRVRSHNDDVPVPKPTTVRVTRSQKKKLNETAQTAKQPETVKRRKLQTTDSVVEVETRVTRTSENTLKDESAKKSAEMQDESKTRDSSEVAKGLAQPAENASASKSMSKVSKLNAKGKKSPTPTLKDKTMLQQESARGATDENIDVMKQQKEDQVEESSVTSVSTKSRKVLKEVAVSASNVIDNTPEAHKKPEAYTKRKIICARTPSCNEKFDKRIEWKQKHYDQPVTSTPVMTGGKKRNVRNLSKIEMPAMNTTEKDRSCPFDFEVNEAQPDFSMILSPIRKIKKPRKSNGTEVVVKMGIQEGKPVRFPDLLARYKDDVEDPDELHVNRETIKATYCNNKPKHVPKPIVFQEPLVPIKPSLPVKRPRLTKKLTNKEKPLWEKVDKQMEKWLEQTQKEFSDVEQTPLVVEKSP